MYKITWEEIKSFGSEHYKTGKAEPIDLYRAIGFLEVYALMNLVKLAFRMLTRYIRLVIKGGQEKMYIPEFDDDIAKMKHFIMMIEFEEDDK